MVFDASTLLSRTMAGDAELRKAANGLSLGQRKLLGFLDQPQALEELADEHALEREKLARDLAKLASLNLVAVNGEVREVAPAGVVLSGLRAPAMLRWLFPLLLVVSAATLYFVMRSPAPRKPADASSAIASAAAPVPAAAVVAAASVTSLPDSVSAPAIAAVAAVPVAPASTPARDRSAAPAAVTPGADLRSSAAAPPHAAVDTSKAVVLPTRLQVEEPPREATREAVSPDRIADPQPSAASLPKTAAAVPAAASRPDAAQSVAPTTAPAGAPVVNVPVNAPATAAPPAATAAITATTAAPPPLKLAMAAPTSAAAHPAPEPRLLPLTRQDPEFPREALVRGVLTGVVKARLAIDAGGRVSAVNIVDARPSRVFDRAVSDALSRWTFPAGDAGRSTEVEIAFHRD